jgi:hypothetical protein
MRMPNPEFRNPDLFEAAHAEAAEGVKKAIEEIAEHVEGAPTAAHIQMTMTRIIERALKQFDLALSVDGHVRISQIGGVGDLLNGKAADVAHDVVSTAVAAGHLAEEK